MTPNRNLFIIIFSILSISLFAQPDADKPIFNKDQVILDDLIVDGSTCVGFDCTNGESFGFDTIKLKENNLRIKFQDTSNSASFPTNDWQITINDTSNGGQNKFSIDDIDGGRTPFTIEAGAPSHSLYVEADGDVGIKTDNPVVDLHVVEGNTPTLRLEQDGSDGFTPQTWDMAGNEANFFIRDVTNSSKLPFRIRPGAPESSIDIAANGNVGIGTSSPGANLHVNNGGSTITAPGFADQLILQEANGGGGMYIYTDDDRQGHIAFGSPSQSQNSLIRAGYNNNDPIFTIETGGANRMRVSNVGLTLLGGGDGFKAGGGEWTDVSDKRLKKNIQPFTKGLKEVLEINPVYYNYKNIGGLKDNDTHIGVIAQELEEVLPEAIRAYNLVETEKMFDENGEVYIEKTNDNDYLGVNASSVKYLLVNAIKDQQVIIDQQQTQIDELKDLSTFLLNELQNLKEITLDQDQTNQSAKSELNKVYPNPVKKGNKISIDLSSAHENIQEILFYNMEGEMVYSQRIMNHDPKVSIDSNNLSKGGHTYIFKLANGKVLKPNSVVFVIQ